MLLKEEDNRKRGPILCRTIHAGVLIHYHFALGLRPIVSPLPGGFSAPAAAIGSLYHLHYGWRVGLCGYMHHSKPF